MKSLIKSTFGFKGKKGGKHSDSELIPSRRNFKFDEISAATLIDLLEATVRRKTADRVKNGIQYSNNALVDAVVDSFMEGTLTKEKYLKHDASTLWSVVIRLLETCNPILSDETCVNLPTATELQVSTLTDGLPLHYQQILGALFATSEILIKNDASCSQTVISSLSIALMWSLPPGSSKCSDAFVNLVSSHRSNLPYSFTFSRRVGSAHDEIPRSGWQSIASSAAQDALPGSAAALAAATSGSGTPSIPLSPPQSPVSPAGGSAVSPTVTSSLEFSTYESSGRRDHSDKSGLYKPAAVQKSLQLNVVDDDSLTSSPPQNAAKKLSSDGTSNKTLGHKLSHNNIANNAVRHKASAKDDWSNVGSSSSGKLRRSSHSSASASDVSDAPDDAAALSLRDLQEVFGSSLVSAASLEYLNVRELREDDYADVKALVRNVKWTLSHSELAAAVTAFNAKAKESVKGILSWQDFLVVARPFLHRTDKQHINRHTIAYDQPYKRPEPATATAEAKKPAAAGSKSAAAAKKGLQGSSSDSSSDRSVEDSPVRTVQHHGHPHPASPKTSPRGGFKQAASAAAARYHSEAEDEEEETLDEIVMSNSPMKRPPGGRGRGDSSDSDEGGGGRFRRDKGAAVRNTAARAMLRDMSRGDDSDGDSIPDMDALNPPSSRNVAPKSVVDKNATAVARGGGSAVVAKARGAPLASSLVSDHSFDDELSGDDIPSLPQQEKHEPTPKQVLERQLDNSWDDESFRHDPDASRISAAPTSPPRPPKQQQMSASAAARAVADAPTTAAVKAAAAPVVKQREVDEFGDSVGEEDSNIMALLQSNREEEEKEAEERAAAAQGRASGAGGFAAAPSAATGAVGGMTKRKGPAAGMFSLTAIDKSTTSFDQSVDLSTNQDDDDNSGGSRDQHLKGYQRPSGGGLNIDTSKSLGKTSAPPGSPGDSVFQSVNLNSPVQQRPGVLSTANVQQLGGGVGAGVGGAAGGPQAGEGSVDSGAAGGAAKKKKSVMSKFKSALTFKKKDASSSGAAGGAGVGRMRSASTNSLGTDEGSMDVSAHNNTAAAAATTGTAAVATPPVASGSPSVTAAKKSMFAKLGFGKKAAGTSSPAAVDSPRLSEGSAAPSAPAAEKPHQSSITMREEASAAASRAAADTPPVVPTAAASAAAPAAPVDVSASQGSVDLAGASGGGDAKAAKPRSSISKWFAASSSATATAKNKADATTASASPSPVQDPPAATAKTALSVDTRPLPPPPATPSTAAGAAAPSIAELAAARSAAIAHGDAPPKHHHDSSELPESATAPTRVKRAFSANEVFNTSAAAGGDDAASVHSSTSSRGELVHTSSIPTIDISAPSPSVAGGRLSNPAPKRTLSGIFSAPFRQKPTRSHSIDLGQASDSSAANSPAAPPSGSGSGGASGASPAPSQGRLGSLLRRTSSSGSINGGKAFSVSASIKGNGLGLASLLRGATVPGAASGSVSDSPHPSAQGSPTKHSVHSSLSSHHHSSSSSKKNVVKPVVVQEVTALSKLQRALQKSKDLHEYIQQNAASEALHKHTTKTAAAEESAVPKPGRKLDILEEMKLIQHGARHHELRSFDQSLFRADDAFRSHHHTLDADQEYLEEAHKAWDLFAKRREPLNMIVSAEEIQLMRHLTQLMARPPAPDPAVLAAVQLECRATSSTDVMYPHFGAFVHTHQPIVLKSSLVPDQHRHLSVAALTVNSSGVTHAQIDLALGVKHSTPLQKSVGRRGAWRKRHFVLMVEPWVNPNLGIAPILDITNTTMNTPAVLADGPRPVADPSAASTKTAVSTTAATPTVSADDLCDYYLLEYGRSVASKWGGVPLHLKRSYSINKMISIVTDSAAAKKGKEFTVTFKLNKLVVRGRSTATHAEIEANRLSALAEEDGEGAEDDEEGGEDQSEAGSSVHSEAGEPDNEDEEGDGEEGREKRDLERAIRNNQKKKRSVRISAESTTVIPPEGGDASTATTAAADGTNGGVNETVNQIAQLNNDAAGTAVPDTTANAADIVLENVDTKSRKSLKKKDRNIVTVRLRAASSDERLLWVKMLQAVGTADVYVNTVSY